MTVDNGAVEDGPRAGASVFDAWHPGIRSQIPRDWLPLSTIFRPENVFTSLSEAEELRGLIGLPLPELVVFRPERLAIHETLIRITADISVPDGPGYEDLGINFRRIADTVLKRYVAPHMGAIVARHEDIRRRASSFVLEALASGETGVSTPAAGTGGILSRFGFGGRPAPAPAETVEQRDQRRLAGWRARAESADDPLERVAYRELARLATAVAATSGRLIGDPSLFAGPVAGLVGNSYGSAAIGRLVGPRLAEAAASEGYRLLPPQARPVVMNVKGASASGKSTMRPLQRELSREIGVDWRDFAVISPDIWRKYLLDYGSLGEAYKYAGTFTGHELEIVDRKLDRYMAEKAERGAMSHLLIDRFRFDSFAADSDEAGSNLLTRFGHVVYMVFMITPPEETVERAWRRGLQVGRYKAVDDLLAHNIEAYTGMPELFFTWALRREKTVHFEFLDNAVPLGARPRTVAWGRNGEMTVLDVKCLLDVDRYRKIDIAARSPKGVYPDAAAMRPEANTGFLRDCVARLPAVDFADRETGRIYARCEAGTLVWRDGEALAAVLHDPETRAGLAAVAPGCLDAGAVAPVRPRHVGRTGAHILGRWAGT